MLADYFADSGQRPQRLWLDMTSTKMLSVEVLCGWVQTASPGIMSLCMLPSVDVSKFMTDTLTSNIDDERWSVVYIPACLQVSSATLDAPNQPTPKADQS